MWSCIEIDVFLATHSLNASSLRSVSEGAEEEAEAGLTFQRIQGPFEGVRLYVRLKHEEPSPSLQTTAAESCRVLRRRYARVVVVA